MQSPIEIVVVCPISFVFKHGCHEGYRVSMTWGIAQHSADLVGGFGFIENCIR